jgi:tetratricopeptide (TPR) repeat protein
MWGSLEARIAQKNWEEAARDANNLSELYLTSGDLAQALTYAQQSVELADRSGDAFERMSDRPALADALHQAGRLAEAEAAFREAEEMQKEMQPKFPLLYSLRGYRYCDLLLDQGQYREVQHRAGQTLEWYTQATGASLLDVALDHLSLGRAHLLQATLTPSLSPRERARTPLSSQERGGGEVAQAATHLEQAVDWLRQSGNQDDLPRGLLARAELRRVTGDLQRARADLEEALSIATRGGMRLHEADCYLAYARLYLAGGEEEKARESLAKARRMIGEMGYHRRDGEVAELERALRGEG